jgi:hypothetical protein
LGRGAFVLLLDILLPQRKPIDQDSQAARGAGDLNRVEAQAGPQEISLQLMLQLGKGKAGKVCR